jgi:hypothetical protein
VYEISQTELRQFALKSCNKETRKNQQFFSSYEYPLTTRTILAPISELTPPKRDGNKVWFRSEANIKNILELMVKRIPLPPLEVFSKGKKSEGYQVRDGFHRYYASLAMGYKFIPINLNDWEFEN